MSVQEVEGIVPIGDLRDHLRELTATTPLEILRLAWQTVEDLRSWAEGPVHRGRSRTRRPSTG